MRDIVSEILPILEAHRLTDLDTGLGSLYPDYRKYNLANLPASICHWFGISGFGSQPLESTILDLWPRQFQNIIFIVVDGFGLDMVEKAREQSLENRSLAVWSELDLAPLTSIVPSTTAAALTTFWTGRAPAEHGVVGYEVWLKEFNMIANMIFHSPASFSNDTGSLQRAGFSPETFLPSPVFGPHLRHNGIHPYAFQHNSIARSGLSTMLLQDVDVMPFRSVSDLFVSMGQLLARRANEAKYVYAYWGDLDEHSHHFGPQDERVQLELETFSRHLERFIDGRIARSRGDTLLVITADHGHVSTPRNEAFELRRHPVLERSLVMSPSGEARLPFVYLRPGREHSFLEYLEVTWRGQFIAIPSEQVIASGLFGNGVIYERMPDRIGDYVIFPQEHAYWWFSGRDNPLLGRHGGVSRTEMLVPLLTIAF